MKHEDNNIKRVATPEGYSISVGSKTDSCRLEVATDTAVVAFEIGDPAMLHAIAGFLHFEAGRIGKE